MRHTPVTRRGAQFVDLPLPDALYERLMAAANGRAVTARLLLERALRRAMRAERARQRAAVSHMRDLFGWRWTP